MWHYLSVSVLSICHSVLKLYFSVSLINLNVPFTGSSVFAPNIDENFNINGFRNNFAQSFSLLYWVGVARFIQLMFHSGRSKVNFAWPWQVVPGQPGFRLFQMFVLCVSLSADQCFNDGYVGKESVYGKAAFGLERIYCRVFVKEPEGKHRQVLWMPWYNQNCIKHHLITTRIQALKALMWHLSGGPRSGVNDLKK